MNPRDILHQLHTELHNLRHRLADHPQSGVMLELMRPNLGSTPPGLRRILQPMLATAATLALGALLAVGVLSFTMFLLAGALMYAILTQIFGVELGVNMPQPHR